MLSTVDEGDEDGWKVFVCEKANIRKKIDEGKQEETNAFSSCSRKYMRLEFCPFNPRFM